MTDKPIALSGEPVAWRYSWEHAFIDWQYSDHAPIPHSGKIVQPLFAAPTPSVSEMKTVFAIRVDDEIDNELGWVGAGPNFVTKRLRACFERKHDADEVRDLFARKVPGYHFEVEPVSVED